MTEKTFKKYVDDTEFSDFTSECAGYQFIPTILPAVKRIIVLGDIHGDLRLAIQSFKLAKLIDDKLNWIANPPDTVVVQVGDQIDSCRFVPKSNECQKEKKPGDIAEDLAVLNFFNHMDFLAKKSGGAVYSLLGNHELMNVEGDMRYVSYANYHEFDYKTDTKHYQGSKGRREAFKPGSDVSKMLACTRNSVLIIGSTLFAHAGILPRIVDQIQNVTFNSDEINDRVKLVYLNSIVRKWLLGKVSDSPDKKVFVDDKSHGPFWERIFGVIKPGEKITSPECENSVKKVLKVFKIGHIVVGHTPQIYFHGVGINGTCYDSDSKTNTLWRVDGGFSRAFNVFGPQQQIQVLEIIDDIHFRELTQIV